MKKTRKYTKGRNAGVLLRFVLAGLFLVVAVCYAANCANGHDCQSTGGVIDSGYEFENGVTVNCGETIAGVPCSGYIQFYDHCNWKLIQYQCQNCGSVCGSEIEHNIVGTATFSDHACVHLL